MRPNVVRVVKVVRHEGRIIHDIAVLKLAKPISNPPEGFRVKLPMYGSHVLTGSPAVAAAWGANDESSKKTTLQAVDLTTYSAYECDQLRKRHSDLLDEDNDSYTVVETDVCAGLPKAIMLAAKNDTTKMKGACSGDYGGPLFVDGVQVGILSFGLPPCAILPSVFTAVSFYVKWIAEKTGISLEPNIFLRSKAKPSSEVTSRLKITRKPKTQTSKQGKPRKELSKGLNRA